MGRSPISKEIQALVRDRAKGLCEYCHAVKMWQYVRFTIDHVIPQVRGGSDNLENLALACFNCNRRKSSHITGIDPSSGKEVRLFNPRQDRWARHFIWAEDKVTLLGLTDAGKATIERLAMNRERVLLIRQADKQIGRYPPSSDPVVKH